MFRLCSKKTKTTRTTPNEPMKTFETYQRRRIRDRFKKEWKNISREKLLSEEDWGGRILKYGPIKLALGFSELVYFYSKIYVFFVFTIVIKFCITILVKANKYIVKHFTRFDKVVCVI